MKSPETGLKVLVVGSGARDHAVVKACLQSSAVEKVIAAPGNAGIGLEIATINLDLSQPAQLAQLIREYPVDLAIIGSKRALMHGVVDICKEHNIKVFGPEKAQAELETNELFLKKFLSKQNIPTPNWAYFTNTEAAIRGLKKEKFPAVLKVSGLPAGQNVSIVGNYEEAESIVHQLEKDSLFGKEGQWLLVENYLVGEPISATLILSGNDYQILPFCKAYKRIGENNTGLNTPGMGAYAPTRLISDELKSQITTSILEPFIKGLNSEKISYCGALYIVIMLTRSGPKVFDVKVRFGDPECQTIIPLLTENLSEIIIQACNGKLQSGYAPTNDNYAITVSKSLTGYPETGSKDQIITTATLPDENIQVIHANTKNTTESLIQTQGGRPLSVTAHASTLLEAIADCYAACEQTAFISEYYRKDIGLKEIETTEIF